MAAQVPKTTTCCTTHPKEEVALFCVSCDQGICMTCVTENSHGQHKLCKPHQIIEVKKKQFQDLMEKEDKKKQVSKNINEQIMQINNHMASVTDHQTKTATTIDKRSTELVQLIQQEKASLLQHSKRLHDQELSLLRDQKSVAIRCLSLLEKHKNDPDSFLHIPEDEMLQAVRDLKLVQVNIPPVDIKSSVTFDINQQVTAVDVKKMFGTIKEKMAATKTMEHADSNMKLVNSYKPELFSDTCTWYGGSQGISKISPVDMQTAFVLLGDTLFKVQFDKKVTVKEVARYVKDITQVSNNRIYLCTDTQVKFCDMNGDMYVLDYINSYSVQSVALTKDGNVLVYSETEKIVNRNTVERHGLLSMIDSLGINQGLSQNITENDKQIIKYRMEQHCGRTLCLGRSHQEGAIQWFDQGRIRWLPVYNGNIGSKPAKAFDPRGMCCDNKDQIIIADYGNNALHLLNKDWKFERFLLREWDGLTRPTAITLYNGFLWIGQQDGGIQIRKYMS